MLITSGLYGRIVGSEFAEQKGYEEAVVDVGNMRGVS